MVNNIFSLRIYILVLEYTKTRIYVYGKYTELFESEDLRF